MELLNMLIANQPELVLPLVFLICLIAASFILSKLNFTTNSYDSLKRNSPIDGLRGILALSVFCHHYYVTYFWKTTGVWQKPTNILLDNFGAVSVSFFFLITGYLFLTKISKPSIDWKKLFESRVRRIVPLYAFVSAIVIVITLYYIKTPYTNFDLFKWVISWIVFMGGDLKDFQTGRIISGVNWSLTYEWVFYFSLPIIYMLIHPNLKHKKIFLLLIPILTLVIFKLPLKMVFLLFLFSYPAVVFKQKIIEFQHKNTLLINILIPVLLIYILFFTSGYTFLQEILLGVVFSFIANGYSFFGILKYKGLKILGDISYSTYLLHGLVIYTVFTLLNVYNFNNGALNYFAHFPLVFAVVILVSFLTYNFVELPFLKNHRRLKVQNT